MASTSEYLRDLVRFENRIERIVEKRSEEHARSLIRRFMGVTDGIRLSGEDSPLANAWEEYKEQVQGEHSIYFDAYVTQFRDLAEAYAGDLPKHELELLWMGTEGFREAEGDEREGYCTEDIAELLCTTIDRIAANEESSFMNPFFDDAEAAEFAEEEDGLSVSRRQARRIAEAYLKGSTGRAGGIGDICAREEVARPPSLYQTSFDLDTCWIAYVERPWNGLKGSSEIVVVSMSTGEVVYAGSANDEG